MGYRKLHFYPANQCLIVFYANSEWRVLWGRVVLYTLRGTYQGGKTTVGRRDDTLNTCQDAIQTMLESKDRGQLASDNALFQRETEMGDLEKQVSTNGIKAKITVDSFSTSESGVNYSSDDSMAQDTDVAKTVFK